jgi:hypothetical protein
MVLFTVVKVIQKASAQERQFLDLNAISPYQSQIRFNSKKSASPRLIHSDTFKCEYAESGYLSESGQNVLHLFPPGIISVSAPFFRCLPVSLRREDQIA